jgi:hypothetical protein
MEVLVPISRFPCILDIQRTPLQPLQVQGERVC